MTLEQVSSSVDFVGTAPCENGNFVALTPYSAAVTGPSEVINGIHLYGSHGVWEVPSLGVRVTASGSLGIGVLLTITHSPRAIRSYGLTMVS